MSGALGRSALAGSIELISAVGLTLGLFTRPVALLRSVYLLMSMLLGGRRGSHSAFSPGVISERHVLRDRIAYLQHAGSLQLGELGNITMKCNVLVIAVALPLVACGNEQAKKIEVRPVRVTSVRHTPSGEMISLTGQIQAKDQANLAFRIGGRLQERNVTVGDLVTPGQIVAKIEPQDYQNALRSAEADLASAQAVLANAQHTEDRQSELLSKGFAK